jgi:hypothetical protein
MPLQAIAPKSAQQKDTFEKASVWNEQICTALNGQKQ